MTFLRRSIALYREAFLLYSEKTLWFSLRVPFASLWEDNFSLVKKTFCDSIRGSPSLLLKDRFLLYEKTSFLTYKKFLQTFRSYMKNLSGLLWKVGWPREVSWYSVKRLSGVVSPFAVGGEDNLYCNGKIPFSSMTRRLFLFSACTSIGRASAFPWTSSVLLC